MDERPSAAERVVALMREVLYRAEEVPTGEVPADAVKVEGIVRTFALHPNRLLAKKQEILALVHEIVPDVYLRAPDGKKREGYGEGSTFLNFCLDRDGGQWGDHPVMESLYCLAAAIGKAGFCLPRDFWHSLPGGVPYIWFEGKP